MTTSFKYSGNIGYNDDSQLWREICTKEYKASNENFNIFNKANQTMQVRPKTGGFRNSVFNKKNDSVKNQFENLKRS